MHLDKLIELFRKNAAMYNNPVEVAVLEHLLRLQYLEGLKPTEERKPSVVSMLALANELNINANTIHGFMSRDEDAPKAVPSPDGKRNNHNYYVRDEFYNWWNNRKKK